MEHRSTGLRHALPWLYATVFVAAVGAAVLMWVRARFAENWALPHGIYASAQLADSYHGYRREHGQWPAPGTFVAKEIEYVRTFDPLNMRCDVFNFGGGQYVHLELHGNGNAARLAGQRRRARGRCSITHQCTGLRANAARTSAKS